MQKHHEMTAQHEDELNGVREQSVDVLEELALCKEKLNYMNDEYDLAQNMSNLFTPKQAAETAIRQNNLVKSANWRMVAIRAAFLRLRHAESAADSACASASAMQTFVQHSTDGRVKRAPGMQQVLTALSTAADAQSQFRIVAGGAAKALEPLMDVGVGELGGEGGGDEGSIWESFLRDIDVGGEEKKEEDLGLEMSGIGAMAAFSPVKGGEGVGGDLPPPPAPKTPEHGVGDSDSSEIDFNASSSDDQYGSTSEDEGVVKKVVKKKKKTEEGKGEGEERKKKKVVKKGGATSPTAIARKKKLASSSGLTTRKKKSVGSPTATKTKLKKKVKSPPREKTKVFIGKSARDLLGHASGMRSDLDQLKQAMNACMSQVDADLSKLGTGLAGVMCKLLDKEVEEGKGVGCSVYDSPSR